VSGHGGVGCRAWPRVVVAAVALLAPLLALAAFAPEAGATPVQPGAYYSVRACFATTPQSVTLRLAFYDASGDLLVSNLSPGLADGAGCYRSSPAYAPCAAASASYGATSQPPATPTSLALVLESAPSGSCAAPTPTHTPTPTPTPTPVPPPSAPPRSSGPTLPPPSPPTTAPEASAFAALVNGGFEEARSDGTPYGWSKFGGTLGRTKSHRNGGSYSAFLESTTSSTKWAYQTVLVQEGRFYELSAYVLKDDPAVAAAWLRLSWYASEDGSGSAIGQHDSTTELTDDVAQFRLLTTGPVQAPAGARSVRVRLMLRPRSEARATVYFDDVSFALSSPPAPTPAGSGPSGGGPPSAPASPPPAGLTPSVPRGTTSASSTGTAPPPSGQRPPASAAREEASPGPEPAVAQSAPAAVDGGSPIALANVREPEPQDADLPASSRRGGPSPALVGIGAALGALGLAGAVALVWPGRR